MDFEWLPAAGGMLAGNIIIAAVSSWMRAIVEVRATYPQHPWRMVALTSLFNSGPWLLIVASAFAYYVHSEKWAPSFLVGVLVWWGYVGVLMAITYSRVRAKKGKNAA